MNPMFIILKKQFKDTFKNKSILIQGSIPKFV